MIESTGITEDVDYRTVCEQLQFENEGLRASLSKLNRLGDTIEDVRHFASQVTQVLRKNPYLLVVVTYMTVTILSFILERMHHER